MSYSQRHIEDALTWIEHNHPGGVALVARALAETGPVASRYAVRVVDGVAYAYDYAKGPFPVAVQKVKP
jgi:hypothetical protein